MILKKLNKFGLYNIQLQEFPDSLGDMTSLQWLGVWKNNLTELPKTVGKLSNLEKLWVQENKLETLPESLGNLTNLTELQFFNNPIRRLPESLSNLQKLEKLGINKESSITLEEVIRQRIKQVSVEIKGKFKIISYLPNGVDVIRNAFIEACKVKGNHRLTYMGGGIYDLIIIDKDYKKAEKVLSELTSKVEKALEVPDTTYEFTRT